MKTKAIVATLLIAAAASTDARFAWPYPRKAVSPDESGHWIVINGNPSIAWPDNRKRVLLGRLEIKRLTANTAEEDRRLVFNPSNVPTGIETADMLSSFYSKAFRLSAKEERDVASVAGN
jgi:hypothetical protein